MGKLTQKQAVFLAIINVLQEDGIDFKVGEEHVYPHMTKERRALVNSVLFQGFKDGSIILDASFSDEELKAYVSGLQSNWIRKDSRLNGNTAYVAKNPGSRAGSGDAQIKAMKALLSTLTSETDKAEVQAEIDKRMSEIKKPKAPTVDFSALPESLRVKFTK